MAPHLRKQLVVVGHGMVGHRFVESAISRGLTETYDITVIGEEPRPAYDRVALTSYFEVGAEALSYLPSGRYDDPRVTLRINTEVVAISPRHRIATLANGEDLHYDELVLATGAAPFVPPVPGHDLDGCFVYRTIEDLEAIRDAATRGAGEGRRRHRRRPARAGSRQRAAPARHRDARRRARAAADGGPDRRPGRPDAQPPHRQPRPHRPHRRDDRGGARRQEGPGRPAGPQGPQPARRRHRRLLGRHPAAGRARPRRRPRRRRPRRRPRRRHAAKLRRAHLGDRRVRCRRGPDVRPGGPGLRDGRDRRRPAARAAAAGSPGPTCPPSSSCSASTSPRSATPTARPRARSS